MARQIDAEALKKAFENLASDDYNEPIWYQKTVFETIDNAPTVGPCEKCDYYSFSQAFINGIVEIISKNGITTVDELLEILKGGKENDS